MMNASQLSTPTYVHRTLLRSVMCTAVACGVVLPAGLPAATETMPLSEVKAGMQGVGITVFEGNTRSEFTVHILGVLTNVMGPQRDLIVARLELSLIHI